MNAQNPISTAFIVGAARNTGHPTTVLLDALAEIRPDAAPLFDALDAMLRVGTNYQEAFDDGLIDRMHETARQLEEVFEIGAAYNREPLAGE